MKATTQIVQTFNHIYEPVFTTKKRVIDIWGGRGRGGSHFGTEYFLHLITQPKYFRGYFVRQTFGDIRDSLFRDFKDRIEDNQTLNIEDFQINDHDLRIIHKPTGNMIISKGVKSEGSRTAKMKSLAGATHVLIEEADEVGEEDFDQLSLSLRTMKAEKIQILRIFNPPGSGHWIWRDYNLADAMVVDQHGKLLEGYSTATPKIESNVLSIFSVWQDNKENMQQSTIDELEAFKKKKPEYYYTIVKGLIGEGMKGRVHSGWKTITNDEFNAIDARSIFGQDFGSTSPAALVECKIVNQRLYIRQQNYRGATERQLAYLYCTLGIKDEPIIADSADPMAIGVLRAGWEKKDLSEEEIAKYPQMSKGWNMYRAIKPPGSVVSGINRIKDFEVFYTEDSTDIAFEFLNYKWALDKNKNPTDEPEDNNNHCMDAIRYVVTGKGRYY